MTETGWYTGRQKPVRIGAYKRRYLPDSEIFFCWWSGRAWGFAGKDAESAKRNRWIISGSQNLLWCGLTGELK